MSRIYWLFLLLSTATVWSGPLAQFRTVYGDIDVELFEDKPVTTQNFKDYVRYGLYDGTFFHRLVPNFVIQGGGLLAFDRSAKANTLYLVPTFSQITNEFNVGRRASNTLGTIAMAKVSGDPNSASSQFFFNLTNNSAILDTENGGFTVFGRIVRGTNVLTRFNFPNAATNHILFDTNTGFPRLSSSQNNDSWIYVDISLLNTQVRFTTNNVREISWNSVAGRTNYVEYMYLTNALPKWFQLTATNGNGTSFKAFDTSPSTTNRFYRIRIDYPANPLP
jgi:cyclophilin family peptidyl-prolyl cis-trans isomerase